MIIRKDGKSNIYKGDCFNKSITNELKSKNINIGLMNPPYSQKDVVELEFVEHVLDILNVGGIGVMIEGNDNFLGAVGSNNGVREKITAEKLWEPNCITVNYNGSVGEAFYQEEPFWASDDVNILYARSFWKMSDYILKIEERLKR